MDRLEALGSQLSQITMYDIKSMYNQAKNVVLNVSEIEAKVREATNDDPWGASSTLMQDIANRTFNYPEFNEIMPSIYSRFMEKEARQWRQIYKALQLLEYLIKNGSERVVDDARSHVSTIKMLRNFHHIDEKGKDQGINIRNRAKEIVELLSDVDKIRAERRKAKANRNKYTGQGNDGMSFSSGGGGRYGGFGNDTSSYVGSSNFSGGSGGFSNDYGRGGGGGGFSSSSFRDDRRFEEYDAGDDEVVSSSPKVKRNESLSSRNPERKASTSTSPPAPAPAPKEVNLFDGFDDDTFTAPAPKVPNKDLPPVAPPAAKQPNVFDDDGFGDFETAPVASANPAPVNPPAPTNPNQNLINMLKSAQPMMASPPIPQTNIGTGVGTGMFAQPQQQPTMGMGGGMGHRPTMSGQFGNFAQPMVQPVFGAVGGGPAMQPMQSFNTGPKPMQPAVQPTPPAAKPASSGNFDDLWSMSLGAKPAPAGNANKSIKDLEKEKATAGLWGQQSQQPKPAAMGMGSGFGSFSTSTTTTTTTSTGGGDDDLLL